MIEYTREQLIEICETAIVPHEKWRNRHSYSSQIGIGQLWAMLKANVPFSVLREGLTKTNSKTIWVETVARGFASFEDGYDEREIYYLPTPERLDRSIDTDWY